MKVFATLVPVFSISFKVHFREQWGERLGENELLAGTVVAKACDSGCVTLGILNFTSLLPFGNGNALPSLLLAPDDGCEN